MQQEIVEKRNQKEILIRKASSKSLLQPHQEHERNKSQPAKTTAALLKTDSTAADDKRRGQSLNNNSLPMSSGPTGIFYKENTLKDSLGGTKQQLSHLIRS